MYSKECIRQLFSGFCAIRGKTTQYLHEVHKVLPPQKSEDMCKRISVPIHIFCLSTFSLFSDRFASKIPPALLFIKLCQQNYSPIS